jgi:hypothetical protein
MINPNVGSINSFNTFYYNWFRVVEYLQGSLLKIHF